VPTVLKNTAPDNSGDDIKIMLDFMYDDKDEDSTVLEAKKVEMIQSKIQSINTLKKICDVFIDKLNEDLSNNNKDS